MDRISDFTAYTLATLMTAATVLAPLLGMLLAGWAVNT